VGRPTTSPGSDHPATSSWKGRVEASPSSSRRSVSTWRQDRSTARPKRSSSCPTCPRPGRARSCAGCCARPRGADPGTHPTLARRHVVDAIPPVPRLRPGGLTLDARTVPDNWRWRADPVSPGPAMCSTWTALLSRRGGRQHYLEWPYRDWEAFSGGDDPVIDEVAALLDVIGHEHTCAASTARADPGAAPDPGLTRSVRAALGTCSSCGTNGDYGASREFKGGRCTSCAPTAST